MSSFKRSPRRSIATFAAVGALAAAAIVVPSLAAAPAFASDSSTAVSLFADLNAVRTSSDVNVAAVLPNGFANQSAAGLAKLYAGAGHPCSTSATYPAPSTPDAPDFNVPVCEKVSTGSKEASRLMAAFEADAANKPVVNAGLFYTHAGVGVYTKGSHVYGVIDMLGYSTAPAGYLAFAKPTVTGTAKVGHTLTVHYAAAVPDNGQTSGISYETHWYQSSVDIGSGSTYTVAADNVGAPIEAAVTASKTNFVEHTVYSAFTKNVVKGTFSFSNQKTNIIQFIASLTPTGVTSTPATSVTYQWYRGSSAIGGATSIVYAPTTGDIGHQLVVKATYAADGYTTVVRTYKTAKHFAGLAFLVTAAPTLHFSGSAPEVGQEITTTSTGWNPDASFTYTWKLNGVTISGQHFSSIEVTHAMLGKKLTVTYKGSYPTYVTTSRTSAASPKVVN